MVGFVLCTIPKLHWHVLLVSTSFVGASAFMLGVDCFSTAGLKEVGIHTHQFPYGLIWDLPVLYLEHWLSKPVSEIRQPWH